MEQKKEFFKALPSEQGNRRLMKNDGHYAYEYLNELIDNSLDAKASKIKINIDEEELSIIDDGTGMNKDELKEAIRIGVSVINMPNRIGSYGVGLKSALFSIGEKTIIFSKKKNQEIIKLVVDNTDNERNDFEYFFEELTTKEIKDFNSEAGESGTIIKISSLDCGMKKKLLDDFRIRESIGLIYNRKIIKTPIILNEKLIEGINPILNIEQKFKYELPFGLSLCGGLSEECLLKKSGIFIYLNNRLIKEKPLQSYGLKRQEFNNIRLVIDIKNWDIIKNSNGEIKVNNQKNRLEFFGELDKEISLAVNILKRKSLKNKGGGGLNTNFNGKKFESETSLINSIIESDKFILKSNNLFNLNNNFIATIGQQGDFYKILKENFKIIPENLLSSELRPDDFLLIEKSREMIIVEQKFQEGVGSADEKILACDFKRLQYEKIGDEIGYKVRVIYILNSWFLKDKYRDYLEYMRKSGVDVIISDTTIPLSKFRINNF